MVRIQTQSSMIHALTSSEGEPRYLSLKNFLKKQILTGRLPHDRQIPTELYLCKKYRLSRNTVQRAILDLVEEGFLTRRRGKGTFVNFQRSTGQKNLIGVMCPLSTGSPSAYDEVVRGAQELADQQGYQLVPVNTMDDPKRMVELAAQLNHTKTVGTLLVPAQGPLSDQINTDVLTALVGGNQKVVLIDSEVDGPYKDKFSCVTSQNFEGSLALTRFVISRGYRRIAFLRGPHFPSGDLRYSGFVRAMEEAGLAIRPEYSLQVAARDVEQQGIQEVDVFKAMVEPPDAIICVHDLIAINVIRRSAERGLRIPQDWAVAGFDDLYQSRVCNPPLTTMRQSGVQMGRRAMQILIGEIRGQIAEPVVERLPFELVTRESTGGREADRQ